jgi:hypothetical protein
MDLFNSDVYTGQGLTGDLAAAYKQVLKGQKTMDGAQADELAKSMMVP